MEQELANAGLYLKDAHLAIGEGTHETVFEHTYLDTPSARITLFMTVPHHPLEQRIMKQIELEASFQLALSTRGADEDAEVFHVCYNGEEYTFDALNVYARTVADKLLDNIQKDWNRDQKKKGAIPVLLENQAFAAIRKCLDTATRLTQ